VTALLFVLDPGSSLRLRRRLPGARPSGRE
jgi:hypothetical protein